jgi:hypothetical protein
MFPDQGYMSSSRIQRLESLSCAPICMVPGFLVDSWSYQVRLPLFVVCLHLVGLPVGISSSGTAAGMVLRD